MMPKVLAKGEAIALILNFGLMMMYQSTLDLQSY
jgi:hypothetical protein